MSCIEAFYSLSCVFWPFAKFDLNWGILQNLKAFYSNLRDFAAFYSNLKHFAVLKAFYSTLKTFCCILKHLRDLVVSVPNANWWHVVIHFLRVNSLKIFIWAVEQHLMWVNSFQSRAAVSGISFISRIWLTTLTRAAQKSFKQFYLKLSMTSSENLT